MSGISRWNTLRRNILRTRVLVVPVALLALTTAAVQADAAPPSPPGPPATIPVSVDPQGTIHYTQPLAAKLALANVRTFTVQGTKGIDGECSSFDSGAVPPGGPGHFEEEIAFNPTTCEETITTGDFTSTTSAALRALSPGAGPSSAAKAAATSTAAATVYKYAYTKDAYIDPVSITIASWTVNLKWATNLNSYHDGRFNPYHFYYGSWSESANPAYNYYRIYSPNGWALQGAKRYTNHEFSYVIAFLLGPAGVLLCGGVGDAVFKFDETTYGRWNGSRAYSTIHSKAGACTNLTHYAHWDDYGWSS